MNCSKFLTLVLLLVFIISFNYCESVHTLEDELIVDEEPITIGIIGSGISGAYTAYSLRKWLNTSYPSLLVNIEIIDRNNYIGGRINSIIIDNFHFESGASIIHHSNQYLFNLSEELNLTRIKPKSENSEIGLWNFSLLKFNYESSKYWIINIMKLFYSYGFSLFTMKSATFQAAKLFYNYYTIQNNENNKSFNSVTELNNEAIINNLTQISLKDYLLSQSVSNDLINELITGIEHVNYNQDPSTISALAGFVGLIPTIDSNLFSIENGNKQLIEGAIQKSLATIKLNHSVVEITSQLMNGKRIYNVNGINNNSNIINNKFHYNYDLLIMATPLEISNITIKLNKKLPIRKYQITIATFISGTLNYSYFNKNSNNMPATVLTTGCKTDENVNNSDNDSDLLLCPFSSLAAHHFNKTTNRTQYKIFSVEPLASELLDLLFINIYEIKTIPWFAYPKYSPPEQFAPFKLSVSDDGEIFYVNAFENSVSCMECMAVAAINTAKLVEKQIELILSDKIKFSSPRRMKHPKSHEFDRLVHEDL